MVLVLKDMCGGVQPVLALVIPVFNNFSGLIASLNSVCLVVPHIIIVIDDGSDMPVNGVELEQGISSPLNIVVLRNIRNLGIVAALNHGLSTALNIPSIKYIARLDAGDRCDGRRFHEQIELMKSDTELGIVGTWALFVDINSGEQSHAWEPPSSDGDIRKKMHQNVCFIHPSWMVSRAAFEAVGLYSDRYQAAEDFELSMRILQRFRGCNIPNYYVTCTTNDSGISHIKRRIQLFSRARIQLRYFDFSLRDSYVGILKTIILLLLPYRVYSFVRSVILSR